MKMKRSDALGYLLPILLVLVLTVLLVVTLLRLTSVQREMRINFNANMVWVLYQAHAESLTLGDALRQQQLNPQATTDIPFRYRLLLSRIDLLDDGPQLRALQAIGADQVMAQQTAAIRDAGKLIASADLSISAMQQMEAALQAFNTLLTTVSSQAMIAQWEEFGARIDQYRNAVLIVLFLMIGILLCSSAISVRLLFALKKTKENERFRQNKIELQKELENERKISELYRSFGSMASHQFRTPLAIIDASMQRLIRAGKRMDAEEVANCALKARSATQRLTELIERILHADRFMDQLEVKSTSCSLSALALQAIAEQKVATPHRQIVFADEAQGAPAIHCDPILTHQILLNVISNAVKYSADNTTVQVRVYHDGNWVCCEVRDYGRGIRPEDIAHIFERYFRAWTTTDVVGTGLGLHIASELAAIQNGNVQVHSEPGEGSLFSIRLPVSAYAKAAPVSITALRGQEAR